VALTMRRRLLLAALAAGATPGRAETAASSSPVGVALAFLASSATLQEKASSLAASRDTRPEVKAFASGEARAATESLERLRSFARGRGIGLPGEMDAEHKAIWDNLEPLDLLALSRRYAEVEVQALERDTEMYEDASKSPDADVRALAADMLPQARRRLDEARRVHEAVKP
jgi:putative membrane protein